MARQPAGALSGSAWRVPPRAAFLVVGSGGDDGEGEAARAVLRETASLAGGAGGGAAATTERARLALAAVAAEAAGAARRSAGMAATLSARAMRSGVVGSSKRFGRHRRLWTVGTGQPKSASLLYVCTSVYYVRRYEYCTTGVDLVTSAH